MKQKFWQGLFSVILMAGMLLGLVQPQPVQAAAPADPPVVVEVEPQLQTQLQADQTTGYWIYFREKADLSAAYDMDWSARGWYVMNTLQETANRSQANVRAYLNAQGAEYQTFWIDNVILVEQSNSRTFNGLLNFSEIEILRARRTPVLYEPVEVSAGIAGGDSPDAINPDLLHINVDDVWGLGVTGAGIVVGNIDTGVRYTHEALVAQYRGNNGDGTYTHDYNWYDPPYLGSDLVPNDPHNHGSHTMGTMLGSTSPATPATATRAIGMAPGAEWIACQGFDTSSGGADDAALLSCGQFMAAPTTVTFTNPNPDMRPNVVNNSWGDCGTTYDNWYAGVISAWHAAGVYPMFSNGNASNCGYSSPPGLNTVGNPARSGNVTGVGSTGTSDGVYATYSNWGPTDDPDTINPMGYPNLKPQVVAPGSNTSAYGSGDATYGGMTGTSMASPHVAGLVALMWSAGPCLVGDYAATETLIQETAVPKPYNTGGGAVVPNMATGWGEIDALAAVQAAAASCGGAGYLEGNVTETLKAPGGPLEGVTITAYPQGSGGPKTATTDASGYYTMTLFAGLYDVEASSPFYTTVLIEDIEIITDTVETQDIAMDPKGMLWGYVEDADNGFGLDATVTADSGEFTTTNLPDGDYALYLDAGTYTVTATATDYAPETVTDLVLTSGGTLQQDFALLAAVSFEPSPLAITLELGTSDTLPVTLTNNQPTAYDYEFIEKAPIKAPAAGEDVLVVASDTVAATAMEAALTANGYTFLRVTNTVFESMPVADILAYQAVFWAGNAYSASHDDLIEYLDAGGSLYISDNDLGYSNNSSTFYQTYLQATYGGDNGGDLVTGEDIMLGLDLDITADPYPDYFTVGADGVRIFKFTTSTSAAGARIERNSYKAIYTSFDFDDIATNGEETELVARVMDYLAVPDDVPWFDITPDSGTVPAEDYINGTATFYATAAAGITQPGEYEMTLKVDGDPKVEVPVLMIVEPTATQGQIDGIVTSDRPGGPLEADLFIEDSGGFTATVTSDAGTGYYSLWLEAGTYTVTASADGYIDAEEVVVITAGSTTMQDFELTLDAPDISVDPNFLDVTVTFGDSISETLLVENDGTLPLNFEISERGEEFSPTAGNEILLMAEDITAADWQIYRDALTNAGVDWDEWDLETLAFPTLVDLTPYTLLIWVDESSMTPGDTQCQIVVDWLNLGDKALFVASVDFLWDLQNGSVGLGEHNLYLKLQTTYVGDYAGATITALDGIPGDLIGGDFAPPNSISLIAGTDSNGDYANEATSVATTALLYGTGGTGSGYAAMTYYEGADYKTAWLGLNFHNGLTDQAERNLLMENVLAFLYGGGDILWLSEAPITATVPAAGWTEVDVTFDSSVVAEPGVYMAELVFQSNDPLEGRLTIPVTMTVEPTADLGLLEGTVTNDRPGNPLEATIVIEDSGGMTYTVVTDPATGYYYRWLYAGTYTVTASAPGYLPDEAVVVITGAATTVQDFVLLLEQPEIVVTPLSMEETLVFGEVATQTLYIENIGYADLDFTLAEQDGGTWPLAAPLGVPAPAAVAEPEVIMRLADGSVDCAAYENYALREPVEVAAACGAPVPAGSSAGLNAPTDLGYALDIGYISDNFVSFQLGNFTGQSVVGTNAVPFYGMDFDPTGTILYALNDTTDQLGTIDLATGAFTGLVSCPPGGGEANWTGLSIDPLSGTFYGSTATSLFIIDPATGASTLVGSFGTTLMIDIAVNTEGAMYGHDIGTDSIYTIDTATGAATLVGSTGQSANYAQGMDFDNEDGTLYIFLYIGSGANVYGTVNLTTGAVTPLATSAPQGEFEGATKTVGYQDIPWLSEDPTAGTVPMGETGEVDVIFDSGQVPEPGTYIGTLHVNSNDPFEDHQSIPVTLTVLPSGDIGLLDGTVQSLGHCDANPVPAAAELIAENALGNTWTILSSGATGYYSRWLPADTYTLTVSAPDHMGAETVVELTVGMTTTQDFGLRWMGACVSVDPVAYEVTVAQGYDWTESLDISNMGAAGTDFELTEADGGYIPMSSVTAQLPAIAASNNPAARGGATPAQAARTVTFSAGLPNADNIEVLLLTPDVAGGGDISLIQATLAAFPDLNVTLWDGTAGSPTPADLAPYAVVILGNDILWTSSAMDKVTVGNALADYIDAGGKVVESQFTQSYDDWGFGGRYLTGGYSPFTIASLDSWDTNNAMNILEPTHPVMVGVTSIVDQFDQQDPGLAAGATLLATWTTGGYNAVAVNDSVVAINMNFYHSSAWTGDVGTLLHNAIVWLSGGNEPVDVPWVSEIPVTGTVDADSVFTVDVTFVATETMPLGTYTATLVLATDDLGGDIEIPLILHVVGAIAPDVVFTAEDLICQGVETTFTNVSFPGQPPATEFLWDFGDGMTMTAALEDVTHTYVTAGTYDVTLEACNTAGCDTHTIQVEVAPQPVAGFTFVATTLAVDFTNTSTDADTYLWDFGDGVTSTLENPSHTYAAAGEYDVTLYAYNDCGMDEYTVTITVTATPSYLRIWLPTVHKYTTINK